MIVSSGSRASGGGISDAPHSPDIPGGANDPEPPERRTIAPSASGTGNPSGGRSSGARPRAAVATNDVPQRMVNGKRIVRTLVRIAREAAQQQRLEVGWQPADSLARRDRRRRERLEEELGLTLAVERQHAADHLVEHDG